MFHWYFKRFCSRSVHHFQVEVYGIPFRHFKQVSFLNGQWDLVPVGIRCLFDLFSPPQLHMIYKLLLTISLLSMRFSTESFERRFKFEMSMQFDPSLSLLWFLWCGAGELVLSVTVHWVFRAQEVCSWVPGLECSLKVPLRVIISGFHAVLHCSHCYCGTLDITSVQYWSIKWPFPVWI